MYGKGPGLCQEWWDSVQSCLFSIFVREGKESLPLVHGNCLDCCAVNSTEGERLRREAWPLLAAHFPFPLGELNSAQDSYECSPTQSHKLT